MANIIVNRQAEKASYQVSLNAALKCAIESLLETAVDGTNNQHAKIIEGLLNLLTGAIELKPGTESCVLAQHDLLALLREREALIEQHKLDTAIIADLRR